jgi:deoxyribose-phosphate aldolase
MTVVDLQKNKDLVLPTRNSGIALDLDWLTQQRINRSAAERRVRDLAGRRTVKKEWQVAWLLRALTCIDLTALDGGDTPSNVARLCAKARTPLRKDLVTMLGSDPLNVAAVCVYPSLVEVAHSLLSGSGIPVASVAAGFPDGLTSFKQRLAEVRNACAAGASEIDIVIRRQWVLSADWHALYQEVQAFREAAGDSKLKVILGTGNLGNLTNVSKASLVAMMAGADFIKTSTGKESVNATLPVALVMLRAIRHFYERTGFVVGFKAAGGIRKAKNALLYLILVNEELGKEWLSANYFRIGASGLLSDLSRQLEHCATGRYSSDRRHPMG